MGLQGRDILVGDDAAGENQHVIGTLRFQQTDDFGEQLVVGSAQDAEAQHGGVLLHHGGRDLRRGLPQTGVDHFHASITQRASDDLGAPVVAVQARLGDDNADRGVGGDLGHGDSRTANLEFAS